MACAGKFRVGMYERLAGLGMRIFNSEGRPRFSTSTDDGMTGRRRNVMDLHLRVWRPRDYGRENQAIGLSRWRILMKLEAKLSAS